MCVYKKAGVILRKKAGVFVALASAKDHLLTISNIVDLNLLFGFEKAPVAIKVSNDIQRRPCRKGGFEC